MSKKERLDVLLVKKNICETREKAQKYIMAGIVLVNDQRIDKSGTKVPEDSQIRLTGKIMPFASRGGFKLDAALKAFQLDFSGQVVTDIGASTGGFVDCALQHGAIRVYAVDVGYGQLAWKLRDDERVVNMERTNARFLTPDDFSEYMDWITSDVAFISLTKILPAAHSILKENGQGIVLIKPQFEAGREHIGKNGVVKDPDVHKKVIQNVILFNESLGCRTLGLIHSPIQGPQGNIEYLYWFEKNQRLPSEIINIDKLVDETFQFFSKSN